MEEGVVIKPAKAGGKLKPWVLVVILIVFLIVIAGLVFLIIHNNVGNVGQEESSCDNITDEYEMRICLSQEEYNEESGNHYDAVLKKSFDEGNYELFGELVHDRSTDLALDEQCDTSLKWLDSVEEEYVAKVPILTQYAFYVGGIEAAMECDDEEKEAYYNSKINAITTDKRYHDAIAEEEKINEVSGGEDDE